MFSERMSSSENSSHVSHFISINRVGRPDRGEMPSAKSADQWGRDSPLGGLNLHSNCTQRAERPCHMT